MPLLSHRNREALRDAFDPMTTKGQSRRGRAFGTEAAREAALFPEQNPSPVLRIDRDGVLLYANPASAALLALWACGAAGVAPEEIRREVAAALENGSSREIEVSVEGREISFHVVPVAGTNYANFYGRDVTGWKRAEEALRDSEDRLRRLNESLEKRVAERTAQVMEQAEQLRALAVELGRAEQNERKRLAAVLHDHVQQLLVSARMEAALLATADTQAIRSAGERLDAILSEAIEASRSLAGELSPPILQESGLAAALAWLGRRESERSRFQVRVSADAGAEPSSSEVRTLLFDSVRELLLNAIKHSGAQEAQVSMERTPAGRTCVVVSDQGTGFDPSSLELHRGGLGLFGIQQRLIHLGGQMEIESAPGRGTRVSLLAPVEPARDGRSA